MEECTLRVVEYRQSDPEIEPIDFDGYHFILTGPLAWFYRLFKSMDCEDAAVRELWPWLIAEKNKAIERANVNKKAAIHPHEITAFAQKSI